MTAIGDDWKGELLDAVNGISREHRVSSKQMVTALFTLLSETFRQTGVSPEDVKDCYLSAAKVYAAGIVGIKFKDD